MSAAGPGAQAPNLCLDVGPGLGFVALPRRGSKEQRLLLGSGASGCSGIIIIAAAATGQEPLQERRPPRAELRVGHVAVLEPDLLGVARVQSWRPP